MRLWKGWVNLLRRQEDGLSLALVRIGTGLVVLQDLWTTVWSGALPLIWGGQADTPEGFRAVTSDRLTLLGGHYAQVQGLVGVTALMALLTSLGVWTRLTAFVCLQGCITLYALNLMAGGGHDRVILNVLWLLVLSDSGRTLSLTARRRTGRWIDPTPIPAWPRYLLIGQLILMYTSTGLQKIAPEWFPWGDYLAVYNMLLVPTWARYDLAPILGTLAPLVQFATALTWFWESSFWMVGVWLLLRGFDVKSRLRRYDLRSAYALLGLSFHIGLLFLTNLGPFSYICIVSYPCLYHPDELGAALHRIGRWLRRPALPSPKVEAAKPGSET